jgi:nickel/cobalt transporter (NicO) family protein
MSVWMLKSVVVAVGLVGVCLFFPLFVQISHADLFGPPNPPQNSIVAGAFLPGVIAFGLIHGLDPSHGWPVAILYSMRTKKPMFFGFLSSGIIAGAHFFSSIVVVAAYVYITHLIFVPQLYLRFGAAISLGLLAYIFWREQEDNVVEHEHVHVHDTEADVEHEHIHSHQHKSHHSHFGMDQKKAVRSLKGIAVFAFVLGFAHEEQFVILSFAAGGIDPLALIIVYASSISVVLIGVTLLALKVYRHIQDKIMRYNKYIPKITAGLLAAMAIAFATGIMTR